MPGNEGCKSPDQSMTLHMIILGNCYSYMRNIHIMFSQKIFLKLCFLFLWCRALRGELVVDVKDVDSLGVEFIQKDGTLVETVIRETGCEGVRVSLHFI